MDREERGKSGRDERLAAADARISELETALAESRAEGKRRTEKLIALQGLANALAAMHHHQNTLFESIESHVKELLSAERCHVYIVDQGRRELWAPVTKDVRGRELRFRVGEGLAGLVAETGRTINTKMARLHPAYDPRLEDWTGLHVRSFLCAPLRNYEERVIGAIEVLNCQAGPGYFTVGDEDFLVAVGALAAVSIEKSQLFFSQIQRGLELGDAQEKLHAKMKELDILYRIEQEVMRSDDPDSLLVGILGHAVNVIPAEVGAICLSEGEQEVVNLWRRDEAEAEKVRIAAGQGLLGQVSRHGRTVVANDIESDAALTALASEGLGRLARSAVVVPLLLRGSPAGALAIYNRTGQQRNFVEEDMKLLTLIAGQTAKALERVQERQREMDANRLATVGRLLSGVLHDFRTPMSIISGYAQLMAEDDDVRERHTAAAAIRKQIEMLDRMTREILSFARGERSLLLRNVPMNKFLDEMAELLREEFAGYGIALEIARDYLGPVRMDETKMRRVVFNLARNAREAMPSGGRFTLRVSLDASADDVVYDFVDTGTGVPDEVRDKMFSSFVSCGKRDGSGLGLAIVKRIVEEHGGRISFESARNIGTTFTIRIPREGPQREGGGTDSETAQDERSAA